MNPHFLLLLLFLTTTATTTATAATTTIRDTSGRPLRANTTYYILPVSRGNGGGLTTVHKNKTLRCPLYVAQDPHKPSNGLPLKFLPVDPKQTQIFGSDLNIVFDVPTGCVGSTAAWEVGFDEATGKRFITTGGDIGNPGVDTLGSWFNILKVNNKTGRYWYTIRFCPGVCIFCTVLCGDVRVSVQKDGKRLLELVTDSEPLWVMFKKAY